MASRAILRRKSVVSEYLNISTRSIQTLQNLGHDSTYKNGSENVLANEELMKFSAQRLFRSTYYGINNRKIELLYPTGTRLMSQSLRYKSTATAGQRDLGNEDDQDNDERSMPSIGGLRGSSPLEIKGMPAYSCAKLLEYIQYISSGTPADACLDLLDYMQNYSLASESRGTEDIRDTKEILGDYDYTNLNYTPQMLRHLWLDQPVIASLYVGCSFDNIKDFYDGYVEAGEELTAHAVVVLGHWNEWFIIQNSYGCDWGLLGYGYVAQHLFSGVLTCVPRFGNVVQPRLNEDVIAYIENWKI